MFSLEHIFCLYDTFFFLFDATDAQRVLCCFRDATIMTIRHQFSVFLLLLIVMTVTWFEINHMIHHRRFILLAYLSSKHPDILF